MTGAAAGYAAEQAQRAVALRDCGRAIRGAAEALKLERNRTTLPQTALALALCGKSDEVEPIVEELTKRYPEDSLIKSLWLPVVSAAMDLRRNNPANAIDRLQAIRHESVAQFWPAYLRGQAYLSLGQGATAEREFRDILDNRGRAPLSVLYPLAHLGLARAATLQSDPIRSAQAQQNFRAIWASADPDLPMLAQSKRD